MADGLRWLPRNSEQRVVRIALAIHVLQGGMPLRLNRSTPFGSGSDVDAYKD